MVDVKEVLITADLTEFVKFPIEMYKDHPSSLPDLVSDELANSNSAHNPASSHCDVNCSLAY